MGGKKEQRTASDGKYSEGELFGGKGLFEEKAAVVKTLCVAWGGGDLEKRTILDAAAATGVEKQAVHTCNLEFLCKSSEWSTLP